MPKAGVLKTVSILASVGGLMIIAYCGLMDVNASTFPPLQDPISPAPGMTGYIVGLASFFFGATMLYFIERENGS